MDQRTQGNEAQTGTSRPKRGTRWATYFLIAFLLAIPIWYQFIMMPKMRLTAFRAIVEDQNAQGEVTFTDEKGRDAYDLVANALQDTQVKPIPLSKAKPASPEKHVPATEGIVLRNIRWAGGSTFEVEGAMVFGPEIGSGATFVVLPSLWNCQIGGVQDRWSKGVLDVPPSTVPRQKVMPKLGASGMAPGG